MSEILYLIQDNGNMLKILSILQDRLKNPAGSALIHNVAQLHISKQYSEHVQIKFYSNRSLDENPEENEIAKNIFLMSVITMSYFKDSGVLFSSPSDETLKEMIPAVENTLDWSISYVFSDLYSTHVPVLEKLCEKNNHPVTSNEYLYFYFDVSAGQLLQQDSIPPTLKVKELSLNDATVVDEKWGFAPPGLALSLVEDAIQSIGSIGVYEKSEDGNTYELASWLILSQIGAINALHTDEKHRRKGYAEMALKAMVHFAATKRGMVSVCQVHKENINSINLMEKIGFKQGSNKSWLQKS